MYTSISRLRLGLVISTCLCILSGDALADVHKCDSLTLIGNARRSGLCKDLSRNAMQNNFICELASNPDIHLTVPNGAGDRSSLHITVRGREGCEGSRNLEMNRMTNNFRIEGNDNAENNTVCEVNVARYVDRLNALDTHDGLTRRTCRQSFTNPTPFGNRITNRDRGYYLPLCDNYCN
jgi:hypothetical protein